MQRMTTYWLFVRECFFARFCRRGWPLLVLLLVPLSMVLGLGEGFGLPTLFWGDAGTLAPLATGLALVLTYLLIAFYGLFLELTAWAPPGQAPWPHQHLGRQPLRIWILYTALLAGALAAVALAGAAAREIIRFVVSHARNIDMLAAPGIVLLLGVVWRASQPADAKRAGAAPHTAPAMPVAAPAAPAPPARKRLIAFLARQAWVLGRVIIFFTLVLFINWAARHLLGAYDTVPPVLAWLGASMVLAFWSAAWRGSQRGLYWTGFGVVMGYSLLLAWYAMVNEPMNPAVSICILVTGIATVYTVARAFMELSNLAVFIALAAFMAVSGMIGSGAAPPATVPVLTGGQERRSITYHSPDAKLVTLNPEDPAPPSGPHPMIIVCASGGGISAAVWTAAVLGQLEALDSSIPYRIRLITGASGGMLGAAYYVATLDPPAGGAASVVSPGAAGRFAHSYDNQAITFDHFIKAIGTDSLSGMTHQLVLHDIPSALLPWQDAGDRGAALEKAWLSNTDKALSCTFESLEAGERAGWRPSLVFSPMMVEDGRRLLISNLNLDSITSNRWSEPTAITRQESQDGVELFSVYPEARASVTLATAARLNAAFPFVSPAPALAFAERRRAVDAGYFDNYGVDLACRWLHANRKWLDKNASAILILHIRTYKREEPAPSPAAGFAPALDELSVPLNGLFSARAAAMNFRNDHAVQTISDEFNQEGLPPIKTLAIECPLDNLPLTWRLTTTEVQRIARAASRSPVSERLAIVRDWLAGGSMRAWNEDRVVRRMLQAAPATGPALKPYLRYAISEEEDSSWMLFRDGYEFDGFEVLLVKELCTRLTEKLGLPTPIEPLRVGPIAWRRLLELPKRDEADIVLSSISFRPEREQRYELRFSTPYHQTHQVFAWMGESDTPPPFEHFAGGVAVQLDTTSHRLLNRLTSHAAGVAPQWPEAQVKAFATLTEAAEALKRGDARAILTEEPYVTLLNARLGILATAQSQIRHTDFDAPWLRALLTDTQERGEYYCIGMADDCPRLLWLTNTILAEMARDGTIPRLGEAARKKASLVIQPRS